MNDHVLATFTRHDDAEAAARAVNRACTGVEARIGGSDDALDALALGQQAEIEESMPAISVGVMSGPMARGALIWGLVGLVVGALLAIPVTLLTDGRGWPGWQLAIFFALAGALGLSSATFILGAAARSVKEGETTPEDPTAVVRVDVSPDRADEVRRVLVEAGARSTRYVDAPVSRPPSSTVEAPRRPPTDPRVLHGTGSDYDAGFPSDVE